MVAMKILVTFFILTLVTVVSGETEDKTVKNMVFYMHDVVVGSGRTAINIGVGSITRPGFGAMVAIDDLLTSGSSPQSTKIGRGRGMYMSESLDVVTNPELMLVFTAMFEEDGSTLSFQGADRILTPKREVSVVGGTGAFRFAHGYAVIETVSTSLLANAVLRFNVTFFIPNSL